MLSDAHADAVPSRATAAAAAAAVAEGAAGGDLPFDGAGLRSAFALLLVLIQTASAIGLGFVCVRWGSIDPQRGDMAGVQFLIGRIALPLVVFRIVATSSIGSIDLGVIAACSIGKVVAYALTSALTLCAYRSKDPLRRRVLTSVVFGFFATASNDLAIGFPVINAIYGEAMVVYLAANVLVFQTIIQPAAMVAFEVVHALDASREDPKASDAAGLKAAGASGMMWCKLVRSILLNPIMVATALGAAYARFLPFTLQSVDGGGLRLPEPLGGVLDLWTSPFQMLFLFINGAALRSATISLWPALLALMKVVVCAYVSYGLSHFLVNPNSPDAQALREFTFFYGTIPAGGAPLIYAQIFDCGVDVVAAGSILALILAGPIEFMTALFLGTAGGRVNYADVRLVLHICATASAACSGVFVVLVVVGWWGGSFASRAIGVFGVVTLLYELLTLALMEPEGGCVQAPWGSFLYRFLQNVCYVMVAYIEYHLGTRWREGRRARSPAVTLVVLGAALAAALLLGGGNGFHEMCGAEPDQRTSIRLMAWNLTLLVLLIVLAWHGRLLKQRVGGLLPQRRERSAGDLLKIARLTRPLINSIGPKSQRRTRHRSLQLGYEGEGRALEGAFASPEPLSPPMSASFSSPGCVGEEATPGDETTASRERRREGVGGDGVAVGHCLIVLQGLRSLMGVINGAAEALAPPGGKHQGFTPMLILEEILEHGQGCFLLLAVAFQPGVLAGTRELLLGLGANGCCQGYWTSWDGNAGDGEPPTPFYVPTARSAGAIGLGAVTGSLDRGVSAEIAATVAKLPSRVSSSVLDQLA